MRREASRIVVLALILATSGCIPIYSPGQSPDAYQRKFIEHFERAAYSISGAHIFVRNDDTNAWKDVHITLDTEGGYYRMTTGDMEPREVRDLALASFTDESGKAFGPGIRMKSVWVQARYPDGQRVNELAFPAETFGYKSAAPSAANASPN
jgi:hypothetical protein